MEASPAQHDYEETVKVLDEQVGRLFVKADPTKPLSDEDRAMISSVAAQVSQQVENIRLLADAARARADAEAATRRLTRENWQAFAEQNEDGGFKNRASESDLYYTVFAVDALTALQVEPPVEKITKFLQQFGGGENLDFAGEIFPAA